MRFSSRCSVLVALQMLTASCHEAPPPTPPPVEVVIEPVIQRDVQRWNEWIGTTEGAVDAQIRAQVSGYLVSRDYAEGTLVRKGSVLFQIDPRSHRAALEQARADRERAEALLAKAALDVERFTPLVADGAVSQQELDNAIQLQRSARAGLAGAEAAVERAELELSFTTVRSPIDGVAGIARAQVGDLVGPGDQYPLSNVSQVDPIRVLVPLAEREYLHLAAAMRDAVEGRRRDGGVPLELILADGSVWPHPGRAVTAASGVDPTMGTLMMRGEFANPDHVLRPGQYARIRAVTGVARDALLVPQRAILELQGVSQVAVVGEGDAIEMRVVEPGIRDGRLRVIEKGLVPGERVVSEGLQKVRPGTIVTPAKPAEARAATTTGGA